MKFVVIIFCLIVGISSVNCNDVRTIYVNNRKDLKEFRLGESNFYIDLPNDFTIENSGIGKEGQKDYFFYSKDSFLVRKYDFHSSDSIPITTISIEIDEGQRLLDKIYDWGAIKEKVKSPLLNQKTLWTIYERETGYFIGQTAAKKIWIEVDSRHKSEIDSLISFVATLHRK